MGIGAASKARLSMQDRHDCHWQRQGGTVLETHVSVSAPTRHCYLGCCQTGRFEGTLQKLLSFTGKMLKTWLHLH